MHEHVTNSDAEVMARIRSIKPEFWTSEQVAECSPTARLLFVGLWNFADDAGRHQASTKRLKMEVFPGDTCSDSEVAAWVAELVRVGLLFEYEVQGETYWQVTGWHHQKIDKPTVKYPAPPKDVIRRPIGEQSSNGRGVVGDSSPPEGKGEESTGREARGEEGRETPLPPLQISDLAHVFDDHIERDEPDWLMVEAEFIGRWNSLDGVATHHGNSFELIPQLAIHFRRAWRDPGWRKRAEAAMKKFPLQHGSKMSLRKFLEPTTIDEIIGGVHDFEPGKGTRKRRNGAGQSFDESAAGKRPTVGSF